MSDITPAAPAPDVPVADVPAPAAPAAPPAPVNPLLADDAPTAPAAPADPNADPFEDEGVQQFDRAYVRDLREKDAAKRVALKQYEAFKDYSDEERAVWATLATELRENPAAAAAKFRAIADELLPVAPGAPVAPEGEAPPTPDEPKYLTQADLDARDAEAAKARDLADMTTKIEGEATALGYEKGSLEWRELFFIAQHETKADLAAAHKVIEGRKQAIIDAFVASKVAGGGVRLPQEGGAPSPAEAITDFGKARDSLENYLDAL